MFPSVTLTPRKAPDACVLPDEDDEVDPPPFFRRSMTGLALSMAMAKPMFWASPLVAVLMPTT